MNLFKKTNNPKPIDPKPIDPGRKGFTSKQVNRALIRQSSRCNLLDVPFDENLIPYDKDHIDGNSSNNSDDNLQIIWTVPHRLKTNYQLYNKDDEYNLMINNKGKFIANIINKLAQSKHFIKFFKSNNISFNSCDNMFDNGLLNFNKNKEKSMDI